MTSTGSELSKERLRFLQHRVGVFGLANAAIGFGFLAFRAVGLFAGGDLSGFGSPDFVLHGLAAGVFGVVWLLCRGATRTALYIRAVEAVGLVSGFAGYALMGMSIPGYVRPEMIVILVLALGMFARAIYVPSTGRRTLVLSALVTPSLLISTYFIYLEFSGTEYMQFVMRLEGLGEPTDAIPGAILWAVAWWTAVTALSAAASRVIFGLRREVRGIRKLGQYTLERKIGEGGMGIVYEASHAMLRRPTAIKLLPPDKTGASHLTRFEREVRLTARLTHPNTVTVFDYGRTPDGVLYYAMELLEGGTLAEVVEVSGGQPEGRVLQVLRACAGALHEAHQIGLIHRDIKPANIMLCEQGGVRDVAKLLDFGLVKDIEQGDANLSRHDTITGTPQYMSPEAITAPEEIDARTDLYALGAVGYFFLTGEHVFVGKSVVEVCSQHLHETPIPPSERLGREVEPELERAILACLEKKPDDRPESAQALLKLLEGLDGSFTRDQADAWWDEHRGAIASQRTGGSSEVSERTLGVDLNRRRAASA